MEKLRYILRHLQLNTRLNLYVLSFLFVVLTCASVILYQYQRAKSLNETDKIMESYLFDLNFYFEEIAFSNSEMANKLTGFIINDLNVVQRTDTSVQPVNPTDVMIYLKKNQFDPEQLPAEVKKYFSAKVNMRPGFSPVIIYKTGTMIDPFTNENKHIAESKVFNKIKIISDHKMYKLFFQLHEKGKTKKQVIYVRYFQNYNAYIGMMADQATLFEDLLVFRNVIIVTILFCIIFVSLILSLIIGNVVKQINLLTQSVADMARGKVVGEISYPRHDEIGSIVESINMLARGLRQSITFSKELGSGNLNSEFVPLSTDDELGNSLLEMRQSLKKAEDERRRQQQEEKEWNWATVGHARFADIIRKNYKDINEMSFNIISELVKYIKANQGGIFILNNDDKDNQYLEMTGCFAYDRRKFVTRNIKIGEGLVGTCYLEKETIYLSDLPEGYMDIVSGLGDASPRSLILVPIKLNEEVHGVIEMASFEPFAKYQIEFVEKVGEIIASTVSTVRTNMKTSMLLEQYQQQSEEMKAVEEELRQNMEELQATQEETARQEMEMRGTLDAINETTLTYELSMDGQFLKANRKFLENISMNLNDLSGRSLSDFMDHAVVDSESYKKVWRELQRGAAHSGGHQYFFKGKEKWFYETFTPVKDANEQYSKILVLAYDISRIKELEKKVEEQDKEIVRLKRASGSTRKEN